MNKTIVILLAATITTGIAFAAHGGFKDNSSKTATIANVIQMNDDSYVSIEGSIVKRLSEDRYLFKDNSGSMTVEIDNDKWGGISADTKDILKLTGEIEKKFNTVKLDVDKVQKVTK